MARRLLNVVMKKYGVFSSPAPVYSLRRIDPNEYLFYPSTLEAHATAAATGKAKKDVKSPMGTPPPWMESMSPMPAPEPRFQLSSSTDNERLKFLPFCGRDPSGGACKILCADEVGHAVLYDVDAGCFEVVPSFNNRQMLGGSHRVSYLITQAKASAAGSDPRRGEVLYVLQNRACLTYCDFEALVYSDPATEYSHHRNVDRANGCAGKKGWRWNRLPSPPQPQTLAAIIDSSSSTWCTALRCHTLADIGGETAICVSINGRSAGAGGNHCFNTGTQRWTKAGDWTLPFGGRVVHVPELGGLWFGVAYEDPHHLCAVDLSSSFHGEDTSAAPEPMYKWADPTLPKEWSMVGCNLVYVGDGRFCIAKTFEFSEDGQGRRGRKEMAVISGVEVLRAGPTSTKLWMVKHRSRFYEFDRDRIDCVL